MLTYREKEIIQLSADGLSSKEIAIILGISKRTVEAHLRASRAKLKASNTNHLISIAHRSGLITALFITCSLATSIEIDSAIRPSRGRAGIARPANQSRGKREWEIVA